MVIHLTSDSPRVQTMKINKDAKETVQTAYDALVIAARMMDLELEVFSNKPSRPDPNKLLYIRKNSDLVLIVAFYINEYRVLNRIDVQDRRGTDTPMPNGLNLVQQLEYARELLGEVVQNVGA